MKMMSLSQSAVPAQSKTQHQSDHKDSHYQAAAQLSVKVLELTPVSYPSVLAALVSVEGIASEVRQHSVVYECQTCPDQSQACHLSTYLDVGAGVPAWRNSQ